MESQIVQEKGSWLLPIVKMVDGTEYIVDVEQREFREFGNPDNAVNMHSDKGRQIFKEIAGSQWDSYGADFRHQKGMEV